MPSFEESQMGSKPKAGNWTTFRPGDNGGTSAVEENTEADSSPALTRKSLSWSDLAEAQNTTSSETPDNNIEALVTDAETEEPNTADVAQVSATTEDDSEAPANNTTETETETADALASDIVDDQEHTADSEPEQPEPVTQAVTRQRIDDSQLPDPGPALLQNVVATTSGDVKRSRLRRGKGNRSTTSNASKGVPVEVEAPALELESLSGRYASGKPPEAERPRREYRPRRENVDAETVQQSAEAFDEAPESTQPANPDAKPKRKRRPRRKPDAQKDTEYMPEPKVASKPAQPEKVEQATQDSPLAKFMKWFKGLFGKPIEAKSEPQKTARDEKPGALHNSDRTDTRRANNRQGDNRSRGPRRDYDQTNPDRSFNGDSGPRKRRRRGGNKNRKPRQDGPQSKNP